jgi:uncharacterized protein YegL
VTGSLILPFYVLGDVSFSMTKKEANGSCPLDALNQVIIAVKDALDENPILADKVRFSLIDFSDDARTQIPMCDLMSFSASAIPVLQPRNSTSFVAAFKTLRLQIDTDVRQLKADGFKAHRPAVFFVTDGEPTDDPREWQTAFAELTDQNFSSRPNFIPFGVGDARKDTLDQLVYPQGKMRSFVAKDGVDASAAIRQMAEVLIGSVLASANSITSQGTAGGFVLPELEEDDDWL